MSNAEKPCPFCGEMILATAKKCRHCKEYLDPEMRRPQHTDFDRMMMPVDRAPSAIVSGYLGLVSLLPFGGMLLAIANAREPIAEVVRLVFVCPLVGILLGVLALLLGIRALRVIDANEKLHGKGRAWFGIVCGGVCTVGQVVLLVLAFLPRGR